jgi:hypothetical protein
VAQEGGSFLLFTGHPDFRIYIRRSDWIEDGWRGFITRFGQEVPKNASERISIGDVGERRLHLKIFDTKLVEERL